MGIDSIDTPSPPSQSPIVTNHPRHFYLAVDRLQFKMQTLVDLLDLVGRRSCLPIVVCCSTRDELDSLCSSLSPLTFISFSALYSDLGEQERALVIDEFRQVTTRWNQINHVEAGNEDEVGKDDTSHMVIVTDACLPLLASGEPPLNAHLLINYELPAKKGIVASSISYYVQGLVIRAKGPVFATAFSPLMMIIVAIMGSFILAEQIYLGGVLGAILIVIGLYSVLWGKHKEQIERKVEDDIPLPIKGPQVGGNSGPVIDANNNMVSSVVISLPTKEPTNVNQEANA